MAKRCPNCSYINQENDKFCRNCGINFIQNKKTKYQIIVLSTLITMLLLFIAYMVFILFDVPSKNFSHQPTHTPINTFPPTNTIPNNMDSSSLSEPRNDKPLNNIQNEEKEVDVSILPGGKIPFLLGVPEKEAIDILENIGYKVHNAGIQTSSYLNEKSTNIKFGFYAPTAAQVYMCTNIDYNVPLIYLYVAEGVVKVYDGMFSSDLHKKENVISIIDDFEQLGNGEAIYSEPEIWNLRGLTPNGEVWGDSSKRIVYEHRDSTFQISYFYTSNSNSLEETFPTNFIYMSEGWHLIEGL